MFPWIHHSGKKTVKTSSTSKLQKKKKKKRGKNAPKQSTDEEPTSCCGKQIQRVVRLVKEITKKTKSTKGKQGTRKKGIKALEKFNFLRNKQIKTYKSEARKRRSPSEKLAYHTRKQVAAELSIDIHNIQDHDDLTFMVQTDDKMSAFHTHKQPTSKQMRDVENLKHQTDMTYVVPANAKNSTYYAHIQTTLELLKDKDNLEPHTDLSVALQANEIIIANAQLQNTSNYISDKSYFEQVRSVSEYKEFKDFIEKKQVLSHLNQQYGGMESDMYVDRSSIQLDKGHASAFIALYESESESDTPVTEVQYSSNGICVKNGITFMQSEYVFKRNTKANQEVKFFLLGNDDNQLYTRAALTKFQNYEISTMDFKIVRFLRKDFHDIFEVFETLEPYQGKMNDLIQIMEQFELETSQQIHFEVPLQPSIASLSANKWTDKVSSQAAKRIERTDFTSFAENRTKSVGNTSIDKTNTAMLKKATRISQIPPKTESSEKKPSTKELALDSDIRESISKSRNVLPTHRTTDPMFISRTKMVDAKVKKTSKYKAPKLNIFTTLDDDKTSISTVLRDETVRQAIYGWFNNETKIQFQRPSIPWPSMHPLLPYKLRYLDEGLVDTPVVKTSSSPNDSTDETE